MFVEGGKIWSCDFYITQERNNPVFLCFSGKACQNHRGWELSLKGFSNNL